MNEVPWSIRPNESEINKITLELEDFSDLVIEKNDIKKVVIKQGKNDKYDDITIVMSNKDEFLKMLDKTDIGGIEIELANKSIIKPSLEYDGVYYNTLQSKKIKDDSITIKIDTNDDYSDDCMFQYERMC